MSQTQRAGAGSHQIQVQGDLIMGVTEERALQIADQRARMVLSEYTREAAPLVMSRIQQLDTRVVELLSEEDSLESLKDPAFLAVLRKAQIGAASTEREDDYEVLARLLSQRAGQDDRYVRASVDKAVQVVDAVDDVALEGLTMFWAASAFVQGGENIVAALGHMAELLGSFPADRLPDGPRWLDHLDMLDLIRVNKSGTQSLRKFIDYKSENLGGHLNVGFEEPVAEKIRAESRLLGAELPVEPHSVKEGFYRLPFQDEASLRRVLVNAEISDLVAEEYVRIAKDLGNIGIYDSALAPKFEELIDAHDFLSRIKTWWDAIPHYPQLTTAGVALAYSNAKRYRDFENISGLKEYLALVA